MAAPAPASEPEGLPFPLQQGEQVLTLVRRHWWFLWPRTILLALIAITPVVVTFWLLEVAGVRDDFGIFYWIAVALWLAYWGIQAFLNWYRYHHDIWVVTNQRLIDVFRSSPLSKRIVTADLVNIQDMRVERHGITATILGYSDLICSTAGTEGGSFNISGVPDAEELQLLIDRERDRERMRRE
jgi:hypothetical protein